MNIIEIFKKHNLIKIKQISENVIMCEQSGSKVILKTDVGSYNNQTARDYLDYLNTLKIEHTVFPKYLYISDTEDYIIMTYEGGIEPFWSEHDNKPDIWGGKNLSIEYINQVIRTMEDLKKIEITPLLEFETEGWQQKIDNALGTTVADKESKLKWYSAEIPNLKEINDLLEKMVNNFYINKELKDEIYSLLRENYESFFSKKLILSNFDFYPRNLLQRKDQKIIMIDWDGVGFEIKEKMFMTFWVHMFGNKEIQEKLMVHYKQEQDFDVTRYRIGLILILLEQIDLWWDTKKLKKAFNICVEYLINYKIIIK